MAGVHFYIVGKHEKLGADAVEQLLVISPWKVCPAYAAAE